MQLAQRIGFFKPERNCSLPLVSLNDLLKLGGKKVNNSKSLSVRTKMRSNPQNTAIRLDKAPQEPPTGFRGFPGGSLNDSTQQV